MKLACVMDNLRDLWIFVRRFFRFNNMYRQENERRDEDDDDGCGALGSYGVTPSTHRDRWLR